MNSNVDIFASIKALIESVFRHRGKLVAYNLLVLLGVLALILWAPRKYGSEAKVWLKIGRQNTHLDPTAAMGTTIGVQRTTQEDEIKSVLDVINSRGVIESVVDSLSPEVVLGDEPLPGQEPKPASSLAPLIKSLGTLNPFKQIDPIGPREEAVREIESELAVDAQRKSNVVSIRYAADDPRLAQAVVTNVLEAYKRRHNEIHQTKGSQKFFKEQRALLRNRVEQCANEVKAAKDKIGIASIAGQKAMLEEEMLAVERERLTTNQKLAESKALVKELESLIKSNPEYVQAEERSVPNTGRDSLRGQLFTLQMERMKLEQTYSDDNPLVLAAQAREEKAASMLTEDDERRSETVTTLNKIHQDLALDLAKAKAGIAGQGAMLSTLEEQETGIRKRMAAVNQSEIDLAELERELRLAESNFLSYSEKYEDARVDEALNQSAISNIGIAQEPTYQEKPVSPALLLLLALGAAAMIGGSVAITVFCHTIFDRDLMTERDTENLSETLSIPVVVAIPQQLGYQRTLR